MGDFNMTLGYYHLKDFSDANDFENLMKEPTCFKSTLPTTNQLCQTTMTQTLTNY